MNSLNSDPNTSLGQNKFKSYDLSSQYFQNMYYRLPNSSSINSADFAPLQTPFGTNQLLAPQFSFQYSDNQGLGDGLGTAAGGHSSVWGAAAHAAALPAPSAAAAAHAAAAAQSRNNPPQTIDPNSAHFFSIPSHGPQPAADQNLYYQYSYGTANNMYWPHAQMLEYKSASQNYQLPQADKSQSWPDPLINSQYPPLSNFKGALSPIDQNNQILSYNTTQAGYSKQLVQNGYQGSQLDSNGSDLGNRGSNDSAHIANLKRTPLGKSDNSINQNKKFSSTSNSNSMNSQIDSLQSQLANDCSIHKDTSNFESNRVSTHNSNQQNYSPKSLSKQHTSPNIDRREDSDFWNHDVTRASSSTNTKSYAKVAKLPSRSSNGPSVSNQTSLTSYYLNNGTSTNSRQNYKPTINGFAVGYSRAMANGSNNNWFSNSTASNGNSWNAPKSKWVQDISSRSSVNNSSNDTSNKQSWAAKVSLTSAEENIRNAEYRIKDIQAQINPKRLDINFEKTRYFVIKSYSEDDVHRSIKYKIWCSTKEGNKRLNEAFQNAQKIGGHILLFFSVNGSGHFCGIAEMTSCVDESVVTGVWCQDKWKGRFSVKWIYVKDVPNTQLRHISTKVKIQKSNVEYTMETKPITNLRDATELISDRTPGSSFKDDPGYQALRIIMDCKSSMSIFDDFMHYEKRELGIES